MMNDGMMIPTFRQPVCTAGQVATIIGRPRPTIGGWISRYPALDLQQVVSGATRMFSCADIGKLVALRLAISAGNMTEALFNGFDMIEPEIEAEFQLLFEQAQLEEWGASGTLRPRLPPLTENSLRLVNRGAAGEGGLVGNDFYPTRAAADSGTYIADLAGYQLPETTLFLGQGLRNAWTRTLAALNGFALDSGC